MYPAFREYVTAVHNGSPGNKFPISDLASKVWS